jgi:AraC family cel operon transcriptional repressor
MDSIELKKAEYIPQKAGLLVTFHLIKWDSKYKSFSMRAGGNINYHSLAFGKTGLHTHEFPEFFLVLSGKIGHWANGERINLSAGSLVFIRPSDQHCFERIEDEQCELVNFAFDLERLLELSVYLGNDAFMRKFTGPVMPPVFNLPPADLERLGLALLKLGSDQTDSVELAKIKSKAVIADLFTKFFIPSDRAALLSSNIPEWLEALCEKMRRPENFMKGVKMMQSLACCTPEHLCKSFRKYFNKTPTDFINELRINHAARLLSDSELKIFSISSDLGFQSLSRFYSVFRRQFGMSPARYRKVSRGNDIPV